jgi:hypothetical protein
VIKNHSICDGNLYQIQSSKMNNRQYYKAKEKGPEGPLGGPINLPKRGIQANAKGVKKATWVSSKPPRRGESKPMLKGAKEPRGFSVSHLQRGIRTLCQISAELPGKLVQREK